VATAFDKAAVLWIHLGYTKWKNDDAAMLYHKCRMIQITVMIKYWDFEQWDMKSSNQWELISKWGLL